jgi:hypothetical protein
MRKPAGTPFDAGDAADERGPAVLDGAGVNASFLRQH